MNIQLVVQIQKLLDQRETSIGVFLNIEGAYNNTTYNTICAALARHGGQLYHHTMEVDWLQQLLGESPQV
jgi:hypothetical protein